MSRLARARGAINLGQGFPDGEGPEDVRRAAAQAVLNGPGQYPPMLGLKSLREAACAFYAARQSLAYDPEAEIVVTAGATEALASSLLALIAPGDEVVLFQPLYDAYLPLVLQAGGTPRLVTLKPPLWRFEEADLAAVFSPKTRLVVFNSPHNPAAQTAGPDQLELLAAFCRRFDVVAVCDEVWELLVYDGAAHRSLCHEPGMRERCVKIGSGGKLFSLTGWKVGWALAPPPLASAIARAHQYLTFTVAPATQAAMAYGLGRPWSAFEADRIGYQRSRDRLTTGLRDAGFAVLDSQATYFVNVDLTASGIALADRTFCLEAVSVEGVAAIPVSAFYAKAPETGIARLCFAKTDAVIDEGLTRLESARRRLSVRSAPL
jgi:aspartate/methionine/tyrosine aminotransferase